MSVFWFNGTFVEKYLNLDPADRGLLLGDGIFETIAVRNSRAIWLDEHIRRMTDAAVELGLELDAVLLRKAVEQVLHRSEHPFEVMRLTLTRGATPRALAAFGTRPSLLVSLLPYDLAKQVKQLTLATSKIRRNETAPSSHLKTLSYIDGIAAAREVMNQADDALMLNTAGHVACSTVGNLFIMRGRELITPQIGEGILPGITRAKIIDHAAKIGLKVRSAIVAVDELYSADAVFLTNSLRLVTPVTMLNGKALGIAAVVDIKQKLETLS